MKNRRYIVTARSDIYHLTSNGKRTLCGLSCRKHLFHPLHIPLWRTQCRNCLRVQRSKGYATKQTS